MIDSYDRCRTLYRAVRAHESSSQADRHAVRATLAAAITAGFPAAAAGASAATAGSGISTVAGSVSTTGAKGLLQLVLGGKLVSGLVVGTVLGTTLSTAVFVGIPAINSRATVTNQRSTSPPAADLHVAADPTPLQSASNIELPPPKGISNLPQRTITTPATREGRASRPRTYDKRDLADMPAPATAPATVQDSLAEETLSLARIQDALNRQNPRLAIMLAQQQDVQFASGQLGEERAAAKVLALCAAGQKIEAAQARVRFASAYPNSPLTKRVNKGCADP